jgi:hypothetical protein
MMKVEIKVSGRVEGAFALSTLSTRPTSKQPSETDGRFTREKETQKRCERGGFGGN